MASNPIGVQGRDSANIEYLSQSPALSAQTIDTLHHQENSGVPLNTTWTFWLDKTVRGVSAAEYEASLKKIYTVSTAESFWSVYHNIPSVAELQMRYSYHLMREERRPLWEEPYNRAGGTWKIKCHKSDTPNIWRELLLAAIGEQYSEFVEVGDDICGVSVSVRERDDILQIWNTDSTKADQAKVIQKIQELCPKAEFQAVFYKPHQTHHAYEGAKR